MSLKDIYDVYKEHYEINDTKKIDVLLSVVLSRRLKGKRTWLLFIGESSIGKNMITEPICYLNNGEDEDMVRKVSDITSNTLVSGFISDDSDLVNKLDGKIMYYPDFSTLVEKPGDQQRAIYSQLRNLYDGFARKDTGTPFDSEKYDVDVTFIGNVTPAIYDKGLIHQSMGSRFVYYKIEDYEEKNIEERAYAAIDYEDRQREIGEVIKAFLETCEVPDEFEINEEMKDYIIKTARWTAVMRATGRFNSYNNLMEFPPMPEKPPRLIKQFRNIWRGLRCLDNNYPIERAKKIIRKMAISCVDPIKYGVYNHMKNLTLGQPISVNSVSEDLSLNRKTIDRRIQELWYQGIIQKDTISNGFAKGGDGFMINENFPDLSD